VEVEAVEGLEAGGGCRGIQKSNQNVQMFFFLIPVEIRLAALLFPSQTLRACHDRALYRRRRIFLAETKTSHTAPECCLS
jgi:hypothetical protein